jgi:hypothetical protein
VILRFAGDHEHHMKAIMEIRGDLEVNTAG